MAKTRLQLQGELVKGGGEKVYGNVFDVFTKTWRNEGIRGIQRGLSPAVRVGLLLPGSTSDLGLFFSMHTRRVLRHPPVPYANILIDPSERLSAGYDDQLPVFRLLSLLGPVSGFYEPIRKTANQFFGLNTKEQSPFTSVFAGAASGAVGGCCFFDTLCRPN